MQNKKEKGYDGEDIARQHYISLGYDIRDSNYTIRGGEIDLVVYKDQMLTFVEVKVVDHIDDIYGYISKSKKSALQRSIYSYIQAKAYDGDYVLQYIFIKNGQIIEIFDEV